METFIRENIFLVAFLLFIIVGLIYMYLFSKHWPVVKGLYMLSAGLAAWTLGILSLFIHMIQPFREIAVFYKLVCLFFGMIFLMSTLIVFFTAIGIAKEKNKRESDS